MECEKCAIHSCGPCHRLYKSETACCKCVPIPNAECTTVAPTGSTTTFPTTTTTSCCPGKSTPCDLCGACYTAEEKCDVKYKDRCKDGSIMKHCPCLSSNGKFYIHGDEVKVGQCTECACLNGTMECEKLCTIKSCPAGQTLLHHIGSTKCCECIETITTAKLTTQSLTSEEWTTATIPPSKITESVTPKKS